MSYGDEVSRYSFLRGIIDLFGGEKNGVGLGVVSGLGERENIELSGKLPVQLKRGLPRAYARWEKRRRGWVPWAEAFATWRSTKETLILLRCRSVHPMRESVDDDRPADLGEASRRWV